METSIEQAIQYGKNELHNRFESEVLLASVLNVARSYLYAHKEKLIDPPSLTQYKNFIKRRKQGEPVAYILGKQEFWSLEFAVNQHTLIPRPETELLVQLTLVKLAHIDQATVVDLGVGSGAVAVALAYERPNWKIIATDISTEALKVANYNIAKHNIKNITLLQANWCQGLPTEKFDAIISNPPYIAENDPHLSDLTFEPSGALVSGKDGLDDIRTIILQSRDYLKEQGLLLLEHGFNQAKQVRELMHNAGYYDAYSIKQENEIERVTIGQYK